MNMVRFLSATAGATVIVVAMALTALPASAQDRYGSIVFSQEYNGGYAWGIAWSYDSRSSARNQATNECRSQGGTSCGEIGWFRNACGALAIGDNNGYGVGWAESPRGAENQAISGCRSYNSNCRLAVSRCAN